MDHGQRWADSVRAEVSKAVLGQDEVVERLLVAMLADGHVLLEGMPGLAKTLLVRSIGTAMGLQCERVQFYARPAAERCGGNDGFSAAEW